MTRMDPDDFYEDDEPIDQITAAFERGEKGITGQPAHGFNETLYVPGVGPMLTKSSNRAAGSLVAGNS